MAIKTTYKLSKLARRVEEELAFYLKEFNKILEEYAQNNNGEYILSDDGTSPISAGIELGIFPSHLVNS